MPIIRFEQDGSIGQIILANPPHNLLNRPFSQALTQAVHDASEADIRVLLIRAEGADFSQGGDVQDFMGLSANTFRTFVSEIFQSYRAIEALQIPTITAVRGAAYGGAFELGLACDFIVAADTARFRCVEASVGSAPLSGAVQRLAERAGRAYAARYAMLSEIMSGRVAGELGIAAFVVPEAEVEATALALATRLSEGPTRSYVAIRTLLKAWSGGGVPAADAVLLDVTIPLHSSEDAKRGRAARAEALAKGGEAVPVVFQGR